MRKALGRGLEALIPGAGKPPLSGGPEAADTTADRELPVDAISRSGEFGLARSLSVELKPAEQSANPDASALPDSTPS